MNDLATGKKKQFIKSIHFSTAISHVCKRRRDVRPNPNQTRAFM